MKKISIKKASNGFIVKVVNSGEGILTEPYSSETFVFRNYHEMSVWMKEFFK